MEEVNNLVVIKSNRHGLLIHLDAMASFEEILLEIGDKFMHAAKFFKDSQMAIALEGRPLTKDEEKQIVDCISTSAGIHVICIINRNKDEENACWQLLQELHQEKQRIDGQFFKGTLRRKEVLESDKSIIIIGDVDHGATVVTKGNAVILGTLKGTVHAGASGNRQAFISALSLQAKQLKIADVTARRLTDERKDRIRYPRPEIAFLDGRCMYVNPLVYENE